jgi:hypothetical protein
VGNRLKSIIRKVPAHDLSGHAPGKPTAYDFPDISWFPPETGKP